MKLLVSLTLLHVLGTVSITSVPSPAFCVCALKSILEDYSLLTIDRVPPRYRSPRSNDIGFFVDPTNWKPVNNATWIELAAMINAPTGIYSHISVDGVHAVGTGAALDSRRSAYLADVIAEFRLMQERVDRYYEKIVDEHTQTCLDETQQPVVGADLKAQWEKFFVPAKV